MAVKDKFQLKIPSALFDTVYSMPMWQKALILIASWVIPLALFWYLFLSVRLGELDTMSSKIPVLKQQIAILEQKKKQLPKMEKDLKKMEAILQKAMQLLPEKGDIPQVLTDISSIANESRLEILAFEQGKEKIKDFYVSIPVTLKFRGPFHNTVVFFDRVSRMPRIVHIKNIEMGGAQESKQIWSQISQGGGQETSSNNVGGGEVSNRGSEGTEGGEGVIQRGGTWIIRTKCQAVTYRFLSPEEQKALRKKKNKNKKKKKKR